MSIKEASTLVNQDVVHQPDFQFASWCRRLFGINRGIYNTIDECLFRFGLKDIVTRRITIISFLTYVHQSRVDDRRGNKIKFGKGMLIATLTRFLNKESTLIRNKLNEVRDKWP
jgi:riboflavin kinase